MEGSSHEGIKGKGKILLNKKNDALLKSLQPPFGKEKRNTSLKLKRSEVHRLKFLAMDNRLRTTNCLPLITNRSSGRH
jgi:hypothetical protein